MNKQEYLMAMHRLYREVYAAHGDKEVYSAEEGVKVVDTFLAGFADQSTQVKPDQQFF